MKTKPPIDYPTEFQTWWSHYPRREAKGDAAKAWEQAHKAGILPGLDTMIKRAQLYAQERRLAHPMDLLKRRLCTKLPATWIRARCWEDEYPEIEPPRTQPDEEPMSEEKAALIEEVKRKAEEENRRRRELGRQLREG